MFDASRFGIEFVASPRHADGILVTGPVSANMKRALLMTYEAIGEPKLVIDRWRLRYFWRPSPRTS